MHFVCSVDGADMIEAWDVCVVCVCGVCVCVGVGALLFIQPESITSCD